MFIRIFVLFLFSSWTHFLSAAALTDTDIETLKASHLSLCGVFDSIDISKFDDFIQRLKRLSLTPSFTDAFVRIQSPPLLASFDAANKKELKRFLVRLTNCDKSDADREKKYFTDARVSALVDSFNPFITFEDVLQRVYEAIESSPLTEEHREPIRKYFEEQKFTAPNLFLREIANEKAAELSRVWPCIQAQAIYYLTTLVALGHQLFDLQRAGRYDWDHAYSILPETELHDIERRQIVWQIMKDSGLVKSDIADVKSYHYNSAQALAHYLRTNPYISELVVGCGSIPMEYKEINHIAYSQESVSNWIVKLFGSYSYHSSHLGQMTLGIDPRERPTIFANALDESLWSSITDGRFDTIYVDEYLTISPELKALMQRKLKPGGQIRVDTH